MSAGDVVIAGLTAVIGVVGAAFLVAAAVMKP
jgi:hypothetical protein